MRLLLYVVALVAAPALAQPVPLAPNVDVQRLATVAGGTARVVHEATSGALYTLTTGGDVYRYVPPYASGVRVASAAEHGLADNVQGLAIDATGTLFVVANPTSGVNETGMIKRGTPDGNGGFTWTTVAQTASFVRSGTNFDHHMNGIVVSPDGASLFVNHGSRTEHGEVESNGGAAPGLREIPLTSVILRVPASASGLVLPNDEAALRASGVLYADGVRNSFDLAFDAAGRLYAAENSGDRDDSDELNWVREGHHYGFPWRMGTHDTPQRFPGYDPDADPLLNPASAGYMLGAFHDDPSYPPPPAGVTFTDPVRNVGPDADLYRDESTGALVDGSAAGVPATTFTPHRSPLGLTFDVASTLPGPFSGDGFVLSWTDGDPASPGASPLLAPFGDAAQDLLHLDFLDPTTVSATRIVAGFEGPMDAVLVGRTMYVVEIGASSGLWAVTFSGTSGTEPAAGPTGVRVVPNPFRAEARVEVEAAGAALYRVELTDVLGRRVAVLHDGPLSAGPHVFTVDGARLPAGSYLVRVTGPGGLTARSFVHVR
jgi:hypothetical protein